MPEPTKRCARLVIGGLDKAGSTTLFIGLRGHPDLTVAYAPYRSGRWEPAPHDGLGADATTLERYNTLLYDARAQSAVAEAAGRSLVVVSLRDPVSRVLSMYQHRWALGRLPVKMDLATYVRVQIEGRPPVHIDDFSVVERGRYAEHLERLWERVGRGSVEVLVLEEWERDPAATLALVLTRAGLDPAALPMIERERINASGVQRFPRVMRAAHLLGRRSMRPVRGTRFEEAHRSRVDRATRWVYTRTTDRRRRPAAVPQSVLDDLTAYYRDATLALEAMLDRDLPWRSGTGAAITDPAS